MTTFALLCLLALSGAALLLIAGQIAEARRVPRSRAAQADAPGGFLRLRQGRTHVRWDGPEGGRVVVCVHGLSTPLRVFDPLTERLAKAGYRVLRYDHFGRGLSDAPMSRQDAAFFTRHLRDVLDACGLRDPVPFVGYSMGGAVVTAFADCFPERTSGICLLASGGLRDAPSGVYGLSTSVPVLGDALWSLLGPRTLTRDDAKVDVRHLPDFPHIVAQEVGRRGTLPSHLSSMRHLLAERQEARHGRLASRGMPVLAIWGDSDLVIPLVSKDRLAGANPAAQQLVLPDAGHDLAFTRPDELADAVIGWLSGRMPGG
ncbi:MAG: alpha/beta hydrolase [Pseudomonadota bacterium]